MKAMYLVALMLGVFVFLIPLSASSEIKEGSVEVGGFGGYNFFENEQNLKDRFLYGGRLGYNFTKYIGIEGAVEFLNTRIDDQEKTGEKEGQFRSPSNHRVDVDIAFYHIDAVYHFMPDGKFNPFIVAGFGGANYSPKISNRDMAAFNVGVGAKYWVTDRVALRADVRDYIVTEIFQDTYHNVGATVGITLALGGKTKPVAQPEKFEAKPAPEKVIILVSEPKVEQKVAVLAAEPKEEVIVLALEDIHFDFDKSTLTKEAQVILKRNLQLLRDNPKAKVRIAGYTSASGTDEYNQKLSERRAKAVQDYLVAEGVVTPERLSKIGYGETNPERYESAPKDLYSEAAKANMRVLFEIILNR